MTFWNFYVSHCGMSELISLVIIVFSFWYIKFRFSRRRLYELAGKLPIAPNSIPFIGHALEFAGNTDDIYSHIDRASRRAHQYGGFMGYWFGPFLYLGTINPEHAEIILNATMEKDYAYRFLKSWLGNGLVASDVVTWKRHRKIISPAFNQKILESFIKVFNVNNAKLLRKFENEIGKGEFDVLKYVSPCNLDIGCETNMGVSINAQNDTNSTYMKMANSQTEVMYQRMFNLWLHPEFIFQMSSLGAKQRRNLKFLKEFRRKVINKKRQEYKNEYKNGLDVKHLTDDTTVKRKPFLELMIGLSEAADGWSDEELGEEVDTLTLAALDTTAATMGFALMILGNHPEVQKKVVSELREVFGNSKRDVEKEDLPNLKYMERVLKETLRIFPIVPIIVRKTLTELKIDKYTVPANTGFAVSVLELHRRKDIWGSDADKFEPDRFLPERFSKIHPYAYIPFSAGPRNCIGKQYAMMSMKVMMANILRSFEISATVDVKTMPLCVELLLRASKGYMISVAPRLMMTP